MNEKIHVDEFSDGFENAIRVATIIVIVFGFIWNVNGMLCYDLHIR
jgi:hypothetical protein